MGAQPQEPPEDVGDVAAEHAPVGVQLVDDDDLQLLEQLEPLGVVGKDGRMEHVRVRDDDLAGLADGRPDRCRGVPVVAGRRNLQARVPDQLRELCHLVLAERLGGEQEQGPGRRILGQRLEHRHRVAERLPGRGRRHDDDVLAGVDSFDGIGLVRVRALDAPFREPRPDPRVQPGGPLAVDGLPCRPDLVVDDAPGERRLLEQPLQDGEGGCGGVGAHGRAPEDETERMSGISRSLRHAGGCP